MKNVNIIGCLLLLGLVMQMLVLGLTALPHGGYIMLILGAFLIIR